MDENENIVELVDDETGETVVFEHLATLEHEGDMYIALMLPEDAGLTLSFGTVSGQMNSEIALRSRDGVQIAGDGAQQFDIHTTSGGLTLRTEGEIPEDK